MILCTNISDYTAHPLVICSCIGEVIVNTVVKIMATEDSQQDKQECGVKGQHQRIESKEASMQSEVKRQR